MASTGFHSFSRSVVQSVGRSVVPSFRRSVVQPFSRSVSRSFRALRFRVHDGRKEGRKEVAEYVAVAASLPPHYSGRHRTDTCTIQRSCHKLSPVPSCSCCFVASLRHLLRFFTYLLCLLFVLLACPPGHLPPVSRVLRRGPAKRCCCCSLFVHWQFHEAQSLFTCRDNLNLSPPRGYSIPFAQTLWAVRSFGQRARHVAP